MPIALSPSWGCLSLQKQVCDSSQDVPPRRATNSASLQGWVDSVLPEPLGWKQFFRTDFQWLGFLPCEWACLFHASSVKLWGTQSCSIDAMKLLLIWWHWFYSTVRVVAADKILLTHFAACWSSAVVQVGCVVYYLCLRSTTPQI